MADRRDPTLCRNSLQSASSSDAGQFFVRVYAALACRKAVYTSPLKTARQAMSAALVMDSSVLMLLVILVM